MNSLAAFNYFDTGAKSFCDIKSKLVPSLKEGLWFVLQPVSCVCLASWLGWKNWPENRLLALQFVRGMGTEETGSRIVDGACCYVVCIHMKLDLLNSSVTEMICLNNAFWLGIKKKISWPLYANFNPCLKIDEKISYNLYSHIYSHVSHSHFLLAFAWVMDTKYTFFFFIASKHFYLLFCVTYLSSAP